MQFSVACSGVRVLVMFHLMFDYVSISSSDASFEKMSAQVFQWFLK